MRGLPQGKSLLVYLLLVAIVIFFIWRFTRHFNIFAVSPHFELPIPTDNIPEVLTSLSAKECAKCHEDFYEEWKTTIHSKAWTDPYFQIDWKFDREGQICKNCHAPLDKQQEDTVLGFNDAAKWDPIVEPNPDFDRDLQHEGVTCAACHLREGKIRGPFGLSNTPHPVEKFDNPNVICMRCHLVENDQWDTFYSLPPCGTVTEIQSTMKHQQKVAGERGISGEVVVPDEKSLKCVNCHMPLVERPLVEGGKVRKTRRHLWRGGHDKEMVKSALETSFSEAHDSTRKKRIFDVTLTNVGTAHYLPTGIPDRQISIEFRVLDSSGKVINREEEIIKRTMIWRPFIFDWSDNRLARWQPTTFKFSLEAGSRSQAVEVETVVRYHLLPEERRKHIGYENKTPIFHELFREKIHLGSE